MGILPKKHFVVGTENRPWQNELVLETITIESYVEHAEK